MTLTLEDLRVPLQQFARHHYGPRAGVHDLEWQNGHSGMSVAFVISGPGMTSESFVIRVAPRAGPGTLDMVRQARLMKALSALGVRVPAVRWFGDGSSWLGLPFHITERMAGCPFQDWDPDSCFDLSHRGLSQLYGQAVDALAAVHQVPVRLLPIAAEAPRTTVDEVEHWWRIGMRAGPPSYRAELDELRDALLDGAPDVTSPGLVHGDFRGGNLLFDHGRLTGVIDWEVAGLGPRLLDLAWLLLFLDTIRWAGNGPGFVTDLADEVIDRYRDVTGSAITALNWYMALARFRWVAIIFFNLMLHESGRRPDPLFSQMKSAVPLLMQDARWSLSEGGVLCPA